MDLQGHAVALIGVATPFVIQMIKGHVLPFSGKSAQLLSLVIAGVAVLGASFAMHQPLVVDSLIQNGALAFGLSQLVYKQVEGTLVEGILTPGR